MRMFVYAYVRVYLGTLTEYIFVFHIYRFHCIVYKRMYLYMYVCIYVRMYVCMYVCMYVRVSTCICVHVLMHAYMHKVRKYLCSCIIIFVCILPLA